MTIVNPRYSPNAKSLTLLADEESMKVKDIIKYAVDIYQTQDGDINKDVKEFLKVSKQSLGQSPGRPFTVLRGDNPHTVQGTFDYAYFEDSKELFSFSGSIIRTRLEIEEINLLSSIDNSDKQCITKTCLARIFFNDIQIFELESDNASDAALHAASTAARLKNFPVPLWDMEFRKHLIGSPIWYTNYPAILTDLLPTGVAVIDSEDPEGFPIPSWAPDSERLKQVEESILSCRIFWYRD